jgi:hypothetical protein
LSWFNQQNREYLKDFSTDRNANRNLLGLNTNGNERYGVINENKKLRILFVGHTMVENA